MFYFNLYYFALFCAINKVVAKYLNKQNIMKLVKLISFPDLIKPTWPSILKLPIKPHIPKPINLFPSLPHQPFQGKQLTPPKFSCRPFIALHIINSLDPLSIHDIFEDSLLPTR
jgi:hypothetical protein